MTIAAAFGELRARLARLQEALDALGTTVDEDRPRRGDVAVAGHLGDAVLAARGALEETRAMLEGGDAAGGPGADLTLRQALVRCHQRFHAYTRQFAAEVASLERVDDLASVARERGRAWADWVGVVRQEFEQCHALADEVADGLLQCWQELLERAGTVAVQNTVIGQQISVPERASRDPMFEGMT